jgi:serine/threonine protein kinase
MNIDPMLGCQINGYEIVELLGHGGMGNVYLALHPHSKQRVAIKILKPELAEQSEAVHRFFQEAKAVNEIRHPHIIEFFDSGTTEGGENYIIMEYLEGELLSSTIKHEGPFSPARLCQIGQQLCSALASAHRRGIVHRDLKPDNVYLINKDNNDDFVKVLDFGIAKLIDHDGFENLHTLTGSVMGTPICMSPEQALGHKVDHRSDIYSFGVILYMMATQRAPLYDSNPIVLANLHVTANIPKPRERNIDIDPALEAIIMRCLEKKRDDRFSSMEEVAFALGAIEVGPNQYVNSQVSTQPLAIVVEGKTPPPNHTYNKLTPRIALLGMVGVSALMVTFVGLSVISTESKQAPISNEAVLPKLQAPSVYAKPIAVKPEKPEPTTKATTQPTTTASQPTVASPQPSPIKIIKKKSEEKIGEKTEEKKVGGGTLNPFDE